MSQSKEIQSSSHTQQEMREHAKQLANLDPTTRLLAEAIFTKGNRWVTLR